VTAQVTIELAIAQANSLREKIEAALKIFAVLPVNAIDMNSLDSEVKFRHESIYGILVMARNDVSQLIASYTAVKYAQSLPFTDELEEEDD